MFSCVTRGSAVQLQSSIATSFSDHLIGVCNTTLVDHFHQQRAPWIVDDFRSLGAVMNEEELPMYASPPGCEMCPVGLCSYGVELMLNSGSGTRSGHARRQQVGELSQHVSSKAWSPGEDSFCRDCDPLLPVVRGARLLRSAGDFAISRFQDGVRRSKVPAAWMRSVRLKPDL